MKHLVSLICVLSLVTTLAGTAVHAAPGSVQPVPEEGDGIEEPTVPGEEPGLPEESPEEIPEEAPEYPEQPAPTKPDDTEPEYPSDDGKGQDRPNPPHRPERPQRPQKPRPQKPRQPRQSHSEVVQIRQQFLGQARLPLYMLTNNLMQLQGYRLVGLTIFGYSQAGMGGAFFCSSSCSQIQPVGGYPGAYRIQTLGEPVNQFAGQWFLELRGNFAIETIQLEFVR